MDRRREPRLSTDAPARLTLLGRNPETLDAQIVNASGRGLRLIVDRRLPLNAPVRVYTEDTILLGETCYAVPEGDRWAVGLMLEQVLREVNELARLVDALLQRGFTSVSR